MKTTFHSLFFITGILFTIHTPLYTQSLTTLDSLAESHVKTAQQLLNSSPFKEKEIIQTVEKIFQLYPSQNQSQSNIGKAFVLLGNLHLKKNEFGQALKHYEQALNVFENVYGKTSEAVFGVHNRIGILYYKQTKIKEMESPIGEMEAILNENQDISSIEQGNFYDLLSLWNIENQKYKQGLADLKLALDFYKKAPQNIDVLKGIGKVYNHEGLAYQGLGKLDLSIECSLKEIAWYQKYKLPIPHFLYINLGVCYRKQGEYTKAAQYYQKAESVILQQVPINQQMLGVTYNNIGICYRSLANYAKALGFYEKALSNYREVFEENNSKIADAITNIGTCHLDLGHLDQAEQFYQDALKIRKVILPPNHPRMGINYACLALVQEDRGNYEQAILLFEKVQAIMSQRFGQHHPIIADGHNAIGADYVKLGQWESARQYYHLAAKSLNYFPKEEKRFQVTNSALYLLSTLEGLTETHTALYQDSKNTIHLDSAQWYAKETEAIIQHIREGFSEQQSHQDLVDTAYPAYEKILEVYYKKYNQTNAGAILEDAFRNIEACKSILLLADLNHKEVHQKIGLSDSLTLKLTKEKKSIQNLEKEHFFLAQSSQESKDSLMAVLNGQLFEHQEQLRHLEKEIATKFEHFYHLKYTTPLIKIELLQQQLSAEQMLIEYFLNDSIIYVFQISADTIEFKKIVPKIDLSHTTKSLLETINGHLELLKQPKDQQNIAFATNAHHLYQELITPLGELPPQVIIVPDGILNYLPFEVLLTEAPSNAADFKSHKYLGMQHQISYNYSTTLWQEMKNKTHNNNELLAFAPSFEQQDLVYTSPEQYRRDKLGPLLFNIEEVQQIQDFWGGTMHINEVAKASTFFEEASNYGILHLATHAKVEDNNSDFSWLAFYDTKDSLATDKIYLKDLYNMRLPAQMVVLSACETGIGELQKGEGVISLARGFAYAGAKSIITSLWKANDQATANLMTLFYENLKTGMSKDAALQQAKMTYIQNATSHEDAHPAKWATFVAIGDMSPLEQERNWMWWGLGTFTLLGVLLFFYKKN